MTSDRYVATRSIREAMKGRETEVLEALGIAWQDGAPHISCPYLEGVMPSRRGSHQETVRIRWWLRQPLAQRAPLTTWP